MCTSSHLGRALTLYVGRCSFFLRHGRTERGSHGQQGASFPPQPILYALFSAPGVVLSRDSLEVLYQWPRCGSWAGPIPRMGGSCEEDQRLHPSVVRVGYWMLPKPPTPGFCWMHSGIKSGKKQAYGSWDKWLGRGNFLFGLYFLACNYCDSSVLLLTWFLKVCFCFSFFPEGFGQCFPKLLWWTFPLLLQQ